MKAFTRDLGFVNFTDKNGNEYKDLAFVNFNNVIVYEAWKKLIASGVPPITLQKCKGVDLIDYKIYGDSKQELLPSEYQQVEYIESTGTQYIDTGLKGTNKTEVELDMQYVDTETSTSTRLFGARTAQANALFIGSLSATTSNFYVNYNSRNFQSASSLGLTKHKIELKQSEVYVDGVAVYTQLDTTTEFTTDYNLILCGASTSGQIASAKARYFGCKIWEDGILLRDFIPCYRISDNVIGMYDLVTETFYTNKGTDTFLKGDDTNAIPTPDAPIEIESVGDKSLNIFEDLNFFHFFGSSYEWYKNGFKATTKKDGGYSNYVGITLLKDRVFEWGKTYTFSCFVEQTNKNMNTLMRVGYFRKDTNSWKDFGSVSVKSGQINKITFTLPSEAPSDFGTGGLYSSNDIQSLFNIQLSQTGELGTITVTDIMVNEGSEVKPYEKPKKYKIPVKVRGKNIYNPATDTRFDLQEDGSYLSNTVIQQNVSLLTNLKGVYTISVQISSPVGTNYRIRVFYTDGTSTDSYKVSTGDYVQFQFKTNGKDIDRIVWYYGSSSNQVQFKDFQIESGDTATDYEPYKEPTYSTIYLKEPLRKIGVYNRNSTELTDTIKDYIDYKNRKVIRNINTFIPTDDKNWIIDNNGEINLTLSSLQTTGDSFASCLSNYLVGKNRYWLYDRKNGVSCTSNVVRIKDDLFTDVTVFKEWLNEKINNGVPFKIYYILKTPIEESIELPNVPLNKGTNIIEVDTTIQPSNMEVEYYGKE